MEQSENGKTVANLSLNTLETMEKTAGNSISELIKTWQKADYLIEEKKDLKLLY